MASIEKRIRNGQTSWRAHYRSPAGAQRNKTFTRKVDAERFLTTVESAKLAGSYIDPAASRLTVGMWAQRWLEGQTHRSRRRVSGTPGSCASTSIHAGELRAWRMCHTAQFRPGCRKWRLADQQHPRARCTESSRSCSPWP